MENSFSVTLNHLDSISPESLQKLYQILLQTRYTDDEGYGFRGVKLSKDYLSATLVKRVTTFIQQYDEVKQQLVDREINLYSEVEFDIDQQLQLLEIFGPVKQAPKVRVALHSILDSSVRVLCVDLAPFKVIPILIDNAASIAVDNLSVNNFRHREGMVGQYTVKLSDTEIAVDVMQKYEYDVVRATLSVSVPQIDDFVVQLARNGYLSIKCEEDQFRAAFLYLKTALFKE